MDIDLKKFTALQKNSKRSFFQQKKLMQQVMMGKTVLCSECKQPLKLVTSRESTAEQDQPTGITCEKSCTTIVLDFV